MYFDNEPGGEHPPFRSEAHIHALYRKLFEFVKTMQRLEDIAKPVIYTLQGLFGSDGAVLCHIHDGGANFISAIGTLSHMQGTVLNVNEERTKRFLYGQSASVCTREELGTYLQMSQNAQFESALITPLTVNGHPFGLIALTSNRGGYFGSGDAETLYNSALFFALLLQNREEQLAISDRTNIEKIGSICGKISPELQTATRDLVGIFGQMRKHIIDQGNSLFAEYINDAIGNIEKMARRVQDLTTLVEICDPPAPQMETLEIAPVLENVIEYNRAKIESCATLKTSIAADLPNIYGDFTLLWQAVHELIQNGIHAIENGPHGDNIIEISACTVPGAAIIEISDTGCGIETADQKHIFDAFFTRWAPAKGLGLTRVKANVLLLKGAVLYKPGAQCGSVFSIILPDEQHAPQIEVF